MAKVRNISNEELSVPLLGRSVEPDTVVEVDDDVFNAHAWPETTWAVVTPAKKKTSDSSEKES